MKYYNTIYCSKPTEWGSATCLAVSKGAQMFAFKYNDGDVHCVKGDDGKRISVADMRKWVDKMLTDFIEEFGLSVTWSHENNEFHFSSEAGRETWDVYSCVIIARWFVSCDEEYKKLIQYMYSLRDKYSFFQSYIIASSAAGHGYYSFSLQYCILDIDMYNALEDKKELIGNCSIIGMNMKISCLLGNGKYRNIKTNEDIESYYNEALASCREKRKVFIKINKDKAVMVEAKNLVNFIHSGNYVHEWKGVSPFNNYGDLTFFYHSSLSQLLTDKSMRISTSIFFPMYGQIGITDFIATWFTVLSPEEFITENIEEIRKYVIRSGEGLYKKPYMRDMYSLFNKLGINMFETINKTKLFNKRIKSWKQL